MQSYFKLPNSIFDADLTSNEFAVLSYLISIYTNIRTRKGDSFVRVRQSVIAEKCGIKATQTVSKVTKSLMAKGYITHILAAYRADRFKGTYSYVLNADMLKSANYTRLNRNVFNYGLKGEELKVYFYINKCIDSKLGYMWGSFTDIAKALKLKRSKVIEIVSYLVEVRRIRKMRRMRYDNRRVYADNSYAYKVVKFIKKRLIKELQPLRKKGCNKKTYDLYHNKVTSFIAYINDTTNIRCCQPVFANFFPKMRKNSIFFYKMGVGTKI